jgi:hypothetical protein
MADPQLIVDWFIRNKKTIARYMFLLQLVAALVFLGVGYRIGERPLHLLWSGARAPGQTVGYEQAYSRRSDWTTFLPVVEFRVGDRFFRFTDWRGSNSTGSFSKNVTVLYDPANPTIAMIDKDTANWLPWSVSLGIGLFLFLVSVAGGIRLLRGQPASAPAIH